MTDAPPVPSNLVTTEALLHHADGPGFAEPWMAQAFACAIQLSRQGLFTWSEWVEVFSAEIKAHPAQPGETSNATYYRQWLAALETIVGLKGAASATEITERQETWRKAYLNTPHGQPVELRHAAAAPAAAHHQHGPPKPLSISPAQR
jgi:nitrile hydratase accessory protein